MKEYAEKFYKSRAWKHTRQAYLEKVGGLCERCLKRGLYVPAEIVHHRVHISPENINDPTVTLDQRNLEALCRDCHAAEHDTSGKRYTLDEFGRVRLRISPR